MAVETKSAHTIHQRLLSGLELCAGSGELNSGALLDTVGCPPEAMAKSTKSCTYLQAHPMSGNPAQVYIRHTLLSGKRLAPAVKALWR